MNLDDGVILTDGLWPESFDTVCAQPESSLVDNTARRSARAEERRVNALEQTAHALKRVADALEGSANLAQQTAASSTVNVYALFDRTGIVGRRVYSSYEEVERAAFEYMRINRGKGRWIAVEPKFWKTDPYGRVLWITELPVVP